MIGNYVRMGTTHYRMGTVIAARFHAGHADFLFHQDPRFIEPFPDTWLSDSELEECSRPTDDQVSAINEQFRHHYYNGDVPR